MDGSCSSCGDMTISELRNRLSNMAEVPLPLSQSGVRSDTRGGTASSRVRGDLRSTVRASPGGAPHPSSIPQPAGVPLVRTGASAEWGTPPSRLDEWFLVGVALSAPPPLVPFFPEVHEELTRLWKVPFTARNKSCGSSPLTTLDGGATLGYTGIPSVERSVAMQLCPTAASTLWGEPCLPSWACKYSSGLTGSAYRACGEAASALHAMALLQVHQAKALRDLHEGGHDLKVLHELRAATDFVL